MKKFPRIIFLVPLIFLVIGLLTLSDFGINWDEPIHFFRGQAYLNYFLTGQKTFNNLAQRGSFFQNDQLTAEYWITNDSGHPPLNGILAAISNSIFYQKLGILGDIESYHLFEVFISFLLVFVVAIFAYQAFGLLPSLVSSIILASYPLFFSESHFNIKDPVEASFFGITIWAFWMSLKKYSWKWLFLSSVFFGLALGTKFNAIFLPLILLAYLVVRFNSIKKLKKIPKTYFLGLMLVPILSIIIFVGSWPFLWHHSLENFFNIVGYYKQIGTGFNYQTKDFYLPFGFNSYSIIWITTTTPPWVLLLLVIGIFAAIKKIKLKENTSLLWLLWLFIPILRVSLPYTSVYGGVRQIMEYIPALSLISGLGALQLVEWSDKLFKSKISKKIIALVIILVFIPHILVMIKQHPNQNVYFNFLIGGLSGAKQKNIPSWGNSYGNAYYQAIQWLNKNAEKNSRIALVQGTSLNIPKIMLRKDLIFNNISWSGINRDGEYLLELTYEGSSRAYPFAWEYIEKFLEPVYEVKVDGVAIAKVWKNDLAHTKKVYVRKEKIYEGELLYKQKENSLIIELLNLQPLTRLRLNYTSASDCTKPSGTLLISSDSINFNPKSDPYPTEFVTEKNKKENTIYYYFNGDIVKVIKLNDVSSNSCIFQNPKAEIFILE